MSNKEYDDLIRFLALGFLIHDKLEPEMLAKWNAGMHRAISMRGGLTEDGKYVVADVGRDVLAEVVETSTRFFTEQLTNGLRDHQGATGDEIARTEIAMSDALRVALDHIEAWRP